MSALATPSAASSLRHASASALVMSSLKRACTMPMRSPLPSSSTSAPLFACCIRRPAVGLGGSLLVVLGDVAGDLEAVARRHAGHATRRAQEIPLVHAAFAQDLRADAVAAQIHAAALGCLRR